jgi:hypothetical protein
VLLKAGSCTSGESNELLRGQRLLKVNLVRQEWGRRSRIARRHAHFKGVVFAIIVDPRMVDLAVVNGKWNLGYRD